MGIDRREAAPGSIEPGLPSFDGGRPPPGMGELERGGGPDPVNLRWVSVREKMAWERDDCAFMSVSFVRRTDVPCRMRLWDTFQHAYTHAKPQG
jgi:hypothetical protein